MPNAYVTETDDRLATIDLAERALAQLQQSLAGKDDHVSFEIDTRSLRGLASVIEATRREISRCAGERCMGRAVDGVKLWVAQAQFDVERTRAERAEARLAGMEAALAAIAASADHGEEALGMLVDWQQHALWMQHCAASALDRA
ncbi:hypothetical protein [Sphingomonas sp. 37zxx]|uniref:hypothetical protein n=1 Tax=Sphingomonas sp. 37zxx TaxID=1550073 RepID=UPI00053BF871|nr:hypothetical protein [Sphingomonas sp. 37zxx]